MSVHRTRAEQGNVVVVVAVLMAMLAATMAIVERTVATSRAVRTEQDLGAAASAIDAAIADLELRLPAATTTVPLVGQGELATAGFWYRARHDASASTWTATVTGGSGTLRRSVEVTYAANGTSAWRQITSREVTAQAPYAAAVLASTDLTTYLKLDEAAGATTLADTSGNARTGTSTGGLTLGVNGTGVAGEPGTFARFDGVDDTVTVTGVPDVSAQATFTVGFWIRLASTPTGNVPIVAETPGGADGWQVRIGAGGVPAFVRRVASTDVSATATSAIPVGVWAHLVAVYDGSSVLLYRDGTLVAAAADSRALPVLADPVTVMGGTTRIAADVDELALWSRALGPDDVGRLAAHGGGRIWNPGAYPSFVRALPGLAAYWRLEEAAGPVRDSSSGGRTSTNASATFGASGLLNPTATGSTTNRAASFNGTSHEIAFGDILDFAGTAPFTVTAWVQPAAATSGFAMIVAKEPGSPRGGWYLGTHNPGSSPSYLGCRSALNLGSWQCVGQNAATTPAVVGRTTFVAMTYDGTTLRMFLNALETSSVASASVIPDNTAPLYIGNAPNVGTRFNGAIDEVAIFTRALAASELQAMYQLGQVSYRETAQSIAPVLAYWPLDDTGSVADDIGPANLDGTYLTTSGVAASRGQTSALGEGLGTSVTFGRGATFNQGSYVELPTMDIDISGGYTISGWIRPVATGGVSNAWERMIDLGRGQNLHNIILTRNDTTTQFGFQTTGTGGASSFAATGTWTDGAWQHMVATHDVAGNTRMYRNGVLVHSGTRTLPARVERFSNFLARSNWATGVANFNGGMDEVVIHGRALTAAEVTTLYNASF